MKDLCQYGNRPEDEWEILPWIPDPRPPFEIWVKPEQIAPFFLIPHHPYAISLLLKINDGFRAEEFCRLGLTGSSEDWERLARGVIREFEENNSGVDLFHFDSDEDVFCVYSQYIDDLMMLAKMIRAACTDETTMRMYLNMSEAAKQADIYTEALVCLRSILCADHPELQNWIDWLERDIQDWTQRREVAHHLRAYGGMGSFNDLPSMRGNRDYIFDFLKSVCYAFGHLYDKREGISPEALMEECLHDAGQASYHPRRELNRAIAQHLRQGDLQENLDRL